MSRQKLYTLKAQLREGGFSENAELLHALVDSGLEALDKLEGGPGVIQQRNQLKERERQVGLALKDLREVLTPNRRTLRPRVDDVRARLILDKVEQMLKAKGPAWHREWSWYAPQIDEEFS